MFNDLIKPSMRAEASSKARTIGPDLEMAISNKFIRQKSGRISIETQAEFGSTLAITSPLQAAKTGVKKMI